MLVFEHMWTACSKQYPVRDEFLFCKIATSVALRPECTDVQADPELQSPQMIEDHFQEHVG